MNKQALETHVAAIGPGERLEQAMTTMLRDCVYQFYFAKHVCLALATQPECQSNDLSRATSWLKVSLLKQAVIGIGATVDLTFSRTSSYWHAVGAVQSALANATSLTPSAQATVDLLQDLRGTTNPDVIQSFAYVRHMRNKWAGHASLDLQFDPWADANKHVHWGLLEDAVVRMVNAFQDLGTLASMSPELSNVEKAWHTQGLEPDAVRMTLGWQGSVSLAEAMRFMARREAGALMQALTPPPN